MRIHTDTLTREDLYQAAREASVTVLDAWPHGSRKRRRAFEVYLSGSSPYATQAGGHRAKAATWDEWGVFLDKLFDRERSLIAGPYDGYDDFLDQTQTAVEAHRRYAEAVGRERPGFTAPWLGVAS